MEFLVFLGGFLLGSVCVYVPFIMANKNTQANFENIANKILKESTSELSQKNIENLDDFFKRFKEKIEDFEKTTKENFNEETKKLTVFETNIQELIKTGDKISTNANSLVQAMKTDNRTSGRWGEIVLERVLEISGLRKGEEYDVQVGTAEGRPDATVYLPNQRCIYVDSKTSFASWDGYVNADNETEKEIHKKQFIESTKSHITGLYQKGYYKDEKSPGYVLMFLPIEGCYAQMFCDDCALWDYAWKHKVMPVSPSTLLAALKIINAFHIADRQNKNTDEITKICVKMIDKVSELVTDMDKIKTAYDSVMTKLTGKGNIVSQLKKIGELGIKGNKVLPNVSEVED